MELNQIVEPLLSWYAKNARDLPWRKDTNPYHVWVSEIMLQQTRVEAVKSYYLRFMEAFPTPKALAEAEVPVLMKLWEGLGYYSRARNLQNAAKVVMEQYGGNLPGNYAALSALPGIGPYTAGAVGSIAFGLPTPAIDGNVLRVTARLTASHEDISDAKTKAAVEAAVREIMPAGRCGAFNQAIMELGATVCGPNGPPKCLCCPLQEICEGYALGIAEDLPVKAPKKPRKIQGRTILLLECGGRLAIRCRPPKGLLAGLWELPSLDGPPEDEKIVAQVRKWGLEPVRLLPLQSAKHIFTHLEWHMQGVRVLAEEAAPSPALVWATPEELRKTYTFSSAFKAYLEPYLST